MNSRGMPSIQINLLLEKDFLHECCQTGKQLGNEKKMWTLCLILFLSVGFKERRVTLTKIRIEKRLLWKLISIFAADVDVYIT